MTIFPEQLKRLRKEKKLSQDDLAEQLFISRQSISKYENGESIPDLDNLAKIANILEVSLDELVLGKKPTKIVERVIEKDDSMNIWEFWDKHWRLIFPIGIFLWLIALSL